MKNSTLKSLVSYLNGKTVANLDEIKAELEAELNKGAAAKAAKVAVYNEAKDVVLAVLADAGNPVTLAELFDACADGLPEGFTKNQLAYALRVYWADEVTKTEGKVNTYATKA